MPPISLLIKPTSGQCNLRCKYCFYHDIAENRKQKSFGMMDIATLEVLVKKALAFAEYVCTFSFQGGEPTLAGREFFEKVIEFQKKYNAKRVKINNSIQTNGTLIDNKWAYFLEKNKFLVGLSLDGTKKVHDAMRVDAKDGGSFDRVFDTAKRLDLYKVDYNILCVVNRYVAENASEIYRFFRENHFAYIQPIPCLDPLGEKPGGHAFSLTPEKYTHFLKTLFDLWYRDIKTGNMVVIRNFDNYMAVLLGYKPEMCMTGECICQYVVEADGSVYPCDFYVLDEWRLGNIKNTFCIAATTENNTSGKKTSIYCRRLQPTKTSPGASRHEDAGPRFCRKTVSTQDRKNIPRTVAWTLAFLCFWLYARRVLHCVSIKKGCFTHPSVLML